MFDKLKRALGRSMRSGSRADAYLYRFHWLFSFAQLERLLIFLISTANSYLRPGRIWKDIQLRSREIEDDVANTFTTEPELQERYHQVAPKRLMGCLLASSQYFKRIYIYFLLLAIIQVLALSLLHTREGHGSDSSPALISITDFFKGRWALHNDWLLYLIIFIVFLINIIIVLVAWWLTLSTTALLGADGLHIFAYHNIGATESAVRGTFARDFAAIIKIGKNNRDEEENYKNLRWLSILASFDRTARDYAFSGFIRLIKCYLLGTFAFGLMCVWWNWALGCGTIIKDLSFGGLAAVDLMYFLTVTCASIGFGDLHFVGYLGKVIGTMLSINLIVNTLFIITWYHTYAFSFKERFFRGVCSKAQDLGWCRDDSMLY